MKARKSNNPSKWLKLKKVRNEVIDLIRKSKHDYIDRLSNKLCNGSLSSRDWWKVLKSFIKPSSSECLPPLYDTDNDTMVTDVNAKASLLNSFFVTQTRLNENDQALPT